MIHALSVKYRGDWTRMAQALKDDEPWTKQPQKEAFVTILDDDYPEKLKRLRYPPWILYFRGRKELLDDKCAAIVGSRDCSQAGWKNAQDAARMLSQKYIVVSGAARGIDTAAHVGSLQKGTIAVVACGLDRAYPKENAELLRTIERSGLVISEYPSGTPPLRHHFPWRNRLIAGLSDVVVVAESEKASGTMHTVDAALELGIPVACMPTPFGQKDHQGCNWLIGQGAWILSDLEAVGRL